VGDGMASRRGAGYRGRAAGGRRRDDAPHQIAAMMMIARTIQNQLPPPLLAVVVGVMGFVGGGFDACASASAGARAAT
jgi:hypothetical protein